MKTSIPSDRIDVVKHFFEQHLINEFDKENKLLLCGNNLQQENEFFRKKNYTIETKEIYNFNSVESSYKKIEFVLNCNYRNIGLVMDTEILPRDFIFNFACALKTITKEECKLFICIPAKIEKSESPSIEEINIVFERLGYQVRSPEYTGKLFNYKILFFIHHAGKIQRPLDRIEGILNKDRKTATYKFALLRSLCDISSENYNSVKWLHNLKVGVPVELISKYWVKYYWSSFSCDKFIPQISGETECSSRPIAFRNDLTKLIREYKTNYGGFNFFGKDPSWKKMEDEVIKKISNTIIKGPVKHSGRSSYSGKNIFSHENGYIIFETELWREITLMSHWIRDSLILQWAKFTSEISSKKISLTDAVELLLTRLYDEIRDVVDSRNLFLQRVKSNSKLECVWSGKILKENNLHVDHVIPFSLWENNELWNLLPTEENVNKSKSDKLPSFELLKKRKDCIIYYWELIHKNFPDRFDREIKRFVTIGNILNWQNQTFQSLTEAIEYTAIQRKIARYNL